MAQSGLTARLEPATIDGLVYASSMVVLYAARHRLPVPALARWTGFEIGFPHDFITDMHTFVFGEAADQVDQPATAQWP